MGEVARKPGRNSCSNATSAKHLKQNRPLNHSAGSALVKYQCKFHLTGLDALWLPGPEFTDGIN
jgi:hypothetical protein